MKTNALHNLPCISERHDKASGNQVFTLTSVALVLIVNMSFIIAFIF